MPPLTPKKWAFANLLLLAFAGMVLLLAACVGPTFFWPFGRLSEEASAILWTTRLPRVLLAGLAGYALGVTGTSFQGLLQNPLADPYILGVSSGAALGSIVGIAFGMPFSTIPFVSFGGAFSAMLLVYGVAATRKQVTPYALLLTGVVLNAFLFAFILLLNGLMSFEQSQKVLLLLIGNLETESFPRIGFVAALVAIGTVLLTREGYVLNLLASGPDAAASLGIDTVSHRRHIFVAASLMIGAVIPLTGLIGFVGLFVPHITRSFFGNDHRLSIPASGSIGAITLVICDTVARTAFAATSFQTELPVGAITAFFGAPFFLYLMKRKA